MCLISILNNLSTTTIKKIKLYFTVSLWLCIIAVISYLTYLNI